MTPSSPEWGPDSLDLETRLLVGLSRVRLEERDTRAVESLLEEEPDWDRLIELALRHKVTPFLCRHLPTFESGVPPDVEEDLEDLEFTTSCQVLHRTGELVQLVTALREAGVVSVPYKGPALAAQVYGSGALRPPGDLDLVVRPRDLPTARAVLEELAYAPRIPAGDAARTAFVLENRYDERFIGSSGARIELHWAFTNRESPFSPDLDELFQRLGTVEVAGHSLPAFRLDDLLLLLSVHGAKHRWERLEWLAAVAEIIRTESDLDWDLLLHTAGTMGVRRTLFLPVLLTDGLFDAPVPPEILQQARADRRAARLAGTVVELLGRDIAGWDPHERLERDRFRLSLLERPSDVVRFLWYRSVTPSEPEEWDVRRVGRARIPLHSLRRPFHVGGQLFAALRAFLGRPRR